MARSKQAATAADTAHNTDTASAASTVRAGVSQLGREEVSAIKSTPGNKPSNSVPHESQDPTRPTMAQFYGQSLAKLLTFPEYWGDYFWSVLDKHYSFDTQGEQRFRLGYDAIIHLMDIIGTRKATCWRDTFLRPELPPDMLPANRHLMPKVSKAFRWALDVQAVIYAASSVSMMDAKIIEDTFAPGSIAHKRSAAFHGQFLAKAMTYPEFWKIMPQDDDLFVLLSKRLTAKHILRLVTNLNPTSPNNVDYFTTLIFGQTPDYLCHDDLDDSYITGFGDAFDRDKVMRAVAASSR